MGKSFRKDSYDDDWNDQDNWKESKKKKKKPFERKVKQSWFDNPSLNSDEEDDN